MPADYDAIKKRLMAAGKSKKAAEAEAAAIHNSRAKVGSPIVTSAGEGYVKKPRNFHHDKNWL